MTAFLFFALLLPIDDKQDQPEDKRPVVELWFAKDCVPDKLQPGEKVNLKIVLAANTTPKGETQQRLREFLRDLEVTEVNIADQPKAEWEAVFVKFRVTPEQLTSLKKIKDTLIRTKDSKTGKTVTRSVPLFVERKK
jgi:hypothetical protein